MEATVLHIIHYKLRSLQPQSTKDNCLGLKTLHLNQNLGTILLIYRLEYKIQ